MAPKMRWVEELAAEDEFVRRLARSLIHDAATADDVAQDAFAAALRLQRPMVRWRPWLAAVVRHLAWKERRASGRRRARETAVARSFDVASTAVRLERELERRRVIDAVFALREPLRSTVLLRWFDDLPPREVAKRLGLPVETVRTRLKTALRELRVKLGRGGDGRRLQGLCAFLVSSASGAGLDGRVPFSFLKAGGLFAMSGKLKLAVAAVAVAILVGGLFWHQQADRDPPQERSTPAGSSTRAAGDEPGSDPEVSADDVALPAVATAPFEAPSELEAPMVAGTLRIRLVDRDGGSPVPEMAVDLHRRSGNDTGLGARRVLTDAGGEALVTDLPAGTWLVYADTGTNAEVDVAAGEETLCTLPIPCDTEVRGRVVDPAGRPVAGASVYVCKAATIRSPGTTESDAEGRFVLRGLMIVSIAATAPGYAPSDAVLVDARQKPDFVEIVLGGPGSRLRGSVVDVAGNPVAADVRLWTRSKGRERRVDATGHALSAPPMFATRSDAEGRFAFAHDVMPGTIALTARAAGHPAGDLEVEVSAGEEATVEIRLPAGCTLEGSVRSETGEPLEGVEIRTPVSDVLRLVGTRSAPDGSYRLQGLTGSETYLEVVDPMSGFRRVELSPLTPGETRRLDLTLARGADVRVRVVDERGAPIRHAIVMVVAEDPGDGQDPTRVGTGEIWTNEEGCVVFSGRAHGRHVVKVRPPDAAGDAPVVATAEAGGPEVTVVVPLDRTPRSTLRGRVVDASGKPIVSARVSWSVPGDRVRLVVAGRDGRFRIEGLRPGSGSVRAGINGVGWIFRHTIEIGAGADVDLGDVRLEEPATVLFTLEAAKGVLPHSGWKLEVTDLSGRSHGSPEVQGGTAQIALQPGDYRVRLDGRIFGGADEDIPFTVRAGERLSLELTGRPGVPRTLIVRCPRAFTAASPARLTVTGPDGRTVLTRRLVELAPGHGLGPLVHRFAPGSYEVVVEHEGARGAAAFHVDPEAQRPPPIVIEIE